MCTLRYAKESVSVGAFLMFVNRFAADVCRTESGRNTVCKFCNYLESCRSKERRHKK